MQALRRFSTHASIVAVMTSALCGCMSSRPVLPHAPEAILNAPAGTAAPERSNLVLRPTDKLSIVVSREPTLSLDSVSVSADGTFDMPEVGRIMAAGKTPSEIAEDIRRQLAASYLNDPHVAVNVTEYASHVVTVEGSIVAPGIYTYAQGNTLLGAIALARGPLRTTNLNQIAIFRDVDGERSVAVFDLKRVRSGEMIDPQLAPGDRVSVGFSGMSQAWQDFLQTAPLIGVFARF